LVGRYKHFGVTFHLNLYPEDESAFSCLPQYMISQTTTSISSC